ncbi:MAG: VanZ family protein [Clostridia bacterium]|nr:VanZ family protein [Clostridia bacterium]
METAYSILHNHLTLPYWLSILIVFIATLIIWKVVEKRQMAAKKNWTQAVLISLLATYIFFILLITLIARTPADARKAELIPFWSWYEVIVNHSTSLAVEIVLNVIFFMPVGILARLIDSSGFQEVKISRVAIFSLSIELTQYFTCRGLCEIFDDVIHNTVGACIGWLVCDRIAPLIKKRYRKALNPSERTTKKHSARRKPM